MNKLDTFFNEIISIIETRRNNAIRKVNEELISLYFDIGKYVSDKVNNESWGSKTIDKLVNFIKTNYPNMKGFSRPGIYRMKQFYETYKDNEFVSPLVRQLGWTNNVVILSMTKSMEEKEFYIKLCLENNYTKDKDVVKYTMNKNISKQVISKYTLKLIDKKLLENKLKELKQLI